jgi:hypothetical protein
LNEMSENTLTLRMVVVRCHTHWRTAPLTSPSMTGMVPSMSTPYPSLDS